jgi:hypothetical protein
MNKIDYGFFGIIIFYIIVYLTIIIVTNNSNANVTVEISKSYYNNNCNNLSLNNTADCLKKELSSFFFFNDSQTGKELTLEEFKSQGGVCIHAANWYYLQGKNLGFEIAKVIINTSNSTGHTFTIISDESGYCVLEMWESHCWEFIE